MNFFFRVFRPPPARRASAWLEPPGGVRGLRPVRWVGVLALAVLLTGCLPDSLSKHWGPTWEVVRTSWNAWDAKKTWEELQETWETWDGQQTWAGIETAWHAWDVQATWVFIQEVAAALPQKTGPVYVSLNIQEKDRLPLSPHVIHVQARPSPSMATASEGTFVMFRVLDKRTLNIHRLSAAVGSRYPAPWGGTIYPTAYMSSLVIRAGQAIRGPHGHFNPATWVILEDEHANRLHEGWLFVRDSAQTAWDHERYDLTFLGETKTPPERATVSSR